MNNEFAWRQPMRELDRAVEPARDLWPQIHARIAAAETRRGRWPRIGLAIAAAAQDLDSASADLQQALEQRPDAVFLVGLLNRTNGQRMRLLREPYAG